MSKEPLPVPEDIKIKIDYWLKPYFPDVSIDVCTGPIDQEKRNEIQRHMRNCLRKGAYFGYSLAASEISLQKAEIERLKELMEKIVRQNHVIYRGQNSSMTESQVAKEVELIWGHFKSKHNL